MMQRRDAHPGPEETTSAGTASRPTTERTELVFRPQPDAGSGAATTDTTGAGSRRRPVIATSAAAAIVALAGAIAAVSGGQSDPDSVASGGPATTIDRDEPASSIAAEVFTPATTLPPPTTASGPTVDATIAPTPTTTQVTSPPTTLPPTPVSTSAPTTTPAATTPATAVPTSTAAGDGGEGTTPDTGTGTAPVFETPAPDTQTPDLAPATRRSATPTITTAPAAAPVSASDPFDPDDDLLVATFDFASNDDAHGLAALRDLGDALGIEPLVVLRTADPATAADTPTSEVLDAISGAPWVDAGTARSAAVDDTATRWISTLDAGGAIWVAEGGVSDFTAEVLRAVVAARPDLETAASVRVIHHRQRDLDASQPDDLMFLNTDATVIRIDDGGSDNGTADLDGADDDFVEAALSGAGATRWVAAFDVHPPASLDLSDVVTALHVLGIGRDEVATVEDFTARFLR